MGDVRTHCCLVTMSPTHNRIYPGNRRRGRTGTDGKVATVSVCFEKPKQKSWFPFVSNLFQKVETKILYLNQHSPSFSKDILLGRPVAY